MKAIEITPIEIDQRLTGDNACLQAMAAYRTYAQSVEEENNLLMSRYKRYSLPILAIGILIPFFFPHWLPGVGSDELLGRILTFLYPICAIYGVFVMCVSSGPRSSFLGNFEGIGVFASEVETFQNSKAHQLTGALHSLIVEFNKIAAVMTSGIGWGIIAEFMAEEDQQAMLCLLSEVRGELLSAHAKYVAQQAGLGMYLPDESEASKVKAFLTQDVTLGIGDIEAIREKLAPISSLSLQPA